MRAGVKTFLLVLLAARVTLAAPGAASSDRNSSHAAAVESFRRGTQLVEAGKLQEAIDAFRDALQLEPGSVGARLDLADCYEKIGTPASAWREYVVAETYARKVGDPREAVARSSATALEGRLLVVTLAGEASPSTELHVDGDAIAPEIVARASFAVAPGRHRLEATAPGKRPLSIEIAGNAGETRPVRLAFEEERAPPAPGADTTSSRPSSSRSSQKTWGFVLGGVGIVGAGVGAAFGGLALAKRSSLETESRDPSIGSARFYADRSSAETLAAVLTVAFVAGGLALAAGVVLVTLGPGRSANGAAGRLFLGTTGTGAVIGGEF